MRPRPALPALLALALPLALGYRLAAPGPAQAMPEPLLWGPRGRSGAAYTELLRLLRDGDGGLEPVVPQKRKSCPQPLRPAALPGATAPADGRSLAGDMHDFFVGLMGKRAAERGGGGPDSRCSTGPPEPSGASPPAA
ncbi:tachykinin-3 isoform X1 [Cuculus canorus]|uniref:tachykinin-3 isoform X1 n=1 Tax=Cuculus canorus TaxID=55661 RepID=UPI0023AB02F4|nr:tachykinin-3 isoform X1 [Cuculus canorus]